MENTIKEQSSDSEADWDQITPIMDKAKSHLAVNNRLSNIARESIGMGSLGRNSNTSSLSKVSNMSPLKKPVSSTNDKCAFINGRAINLEHWEQTLRRTNIYEVDSEPKNWMITEANFQRILDVLQIFDSS